LRQYTDDVLAVLRDAQVTDFVLVGHSMGGKVAQLVAATKPAGLRGLVVVAPGPAVPAPHVTAQYRAQLSRAYDTVESTTFARDQVLTALPLPASVADQVVSDSRSSAASAATEWPLRGIAEDISLSARRIEAPVLVVAGEHDRVEPAEVLRSHLVPYLDDVEMTVVPGSGHLIPLEAAGELANLITMFEHRRAGAACGAARQ
ncbi:MAG: alpha/beta fold hydrolase, partial [Nocardioidaceae bacterium]